ncbi:MAG: glycoside hydrolase family 31 protein, partial [Anaerolineales bacterium]
EAHNLYGLMMNKAGFEGLKKAHPDARPWLLTRSGWAGVQRYAWNWTADSDSSWEMLQQTIPALLNLTLSGLYFSGSDIGGFNGHPDRELYIRWFQLAAFTPFFRLHYATSAPPREPWEYDQEVISIIRQLLILRYRLMPYLYTLAYQAAQDGTPMIRPMVWTTPDNPQVYSIDDQFFLGDIVLVAPVLTPGIQKRSVWLPIGEWVDFWTQQKYCGPGSITIDTNLEQIPLLIKCGHILPLADENVLHLLVFLPSTPSQSAQEKPDELYTDDGDGYGALRKDTFLLNVNDDGFEIKRSYTGEFTWPYESIKLNFIGRPITTIFVDGVQATLQGNALSVTDFELIQGVTIADRSEQ